MLSSQRYYWVVLQAATDFDLIFVDLISDLSRKIFSDLFKTNIKLQQMFEIECSFLKNV